MSRPDPRDELLAAMFAAWRADIDSEPLRTFEDAVQRREHSTGQELSSF